MIFAPFVFAATAAVASPAPSAPPEVRGQLEFPEALSSFFKAASRLEQGSATDDVRVFHFGDSHNTIDSLPRSARRALQSRFGDGGRGFVMLGRPWAWYNQDGIESGETRGFFREKHALYTGPGGVVMHSRTRGSLLRTVTTADATRVTLLFERSPNGAPLSFYVDDTLTAVSTKDRQKSGLGSVSVDVPSGAHRIELRTGDGEAWVYGVELEREKKGIVYDALGIDGAKAKDFVAFNEAWLKAYADRQPPALVVLAYGTNEASDTKALREHEASMREAIAKLKRLAPESACLLLGPPDSQQKKGNTWSTSARVQGVIEFERALAKSEGCAFFDTFAAMGGAGTAHAWRSLSPAASRPDHVHYTPVGYRALSEGYAAALMSAYEAWKTKK